MFFLFSSSSSIRNTLKADICLAVFLEEDAASLSEAQIIFGIERH